MFKYFISEAFAQPGGGDLPKSEVIKLKDLNPLQSDSLSSLMIQLFEFARWIAVPILVIMILIGAFKILTGGSKPDNITQGKKIIFSGIVGFIIILAAESIARLIQSILGG